MFSALLIYAILSFKCYWAIYCFFFQINLALRAAVTLFCRCAGADLGCITLASDICDVKGEHLTF